MKATLPVTLALTALTAFAGQSFAADDAHAGYQLGFYGKRPQETRAAGPVTAKAAFVAPAGGTLVLTSAGLKTWDQDHGPVNTVISGGVASAADAHAGYRRGIAGKS
ncbi:MAG: hypothetical protein CVU18_06655 [Betaproteobacteria bacterium HGW-Betaproteobacteria-12]|nr:MAG: hypothetical protein CVU18_06655 [Betaproteobacteria bacterium HGW-Betaproteobacteria-12]